MHVIFDIICCVLLLNFNVAEEISKNSHELANKNITGVFYHQYWYVKFVPKLSLRKCYGWNCFTS